jgi:hypothetical protein
MPAGADLFNDMDVVVNEFNQNADKVPGAVKSLLGNEVIHAVISMNDGSTMDLKIVTSDMLVTEFEQVDPADPAFEPTIRVTSNEVTVSSLLESETPTDDFLEAYDNGNIVIEGISFSKTVTLAVSNFVLGVSKFLGLV